jgi:hypothetical protein
VVKSVEGHWRLHNVLKYLDDNITRASRKQRLTRRKIKYVAKNVLEALKVLHEDGYVHTGTLLLKHNAVD